MNRVAGVVVGVLILASLAGQVWSGWFSPGDAEDAKAPAAARPSANWLGSWVQVNGKGVIRFSHDGGFKGDYSPDGESIVSFVPQVHPDALTFKVDIQGRTWSLWLTRTGVMARLAGVQEMAPHRRFVGVPGRTPEQREKDEAAWRRGETQRALLPSDLGTFEKLQ
jgi:hypothetical protein